MEDRREEAALSAAPLAMLLLPSAIKFLRDDKSHSVTRKMMEESDSEESESTTSIIMEGLVEWIQTIGTSNEIEDIAYHHKDFNYLLHLLLDLIFDIHYFFDCHLYDTKQSYKLLESQFRYSLYDALDLILQKIDEIKQVKKSLPPNEHLISVGRAQQELLRNPETFPNPEDSVVIGRDKEKKKILDWLSSGIESNLNFSTIAIVGQGGLGKTTLARLVFNDDWVSHHFNLRIWISISYDFDVSKIIRWMIVYSQGKIYGHSDLTSLQTKLMKKLEGKKLLLVLDDVWNEDPSLWESLQSPLLAAEYTRVIVTTRNVSVAQVMQTTDPVRLSYLSEHNSLEILKQCAFQYHSPEKLQDLMKMGKNIVKKCGGLPLAIKSLAMHLRFKHDGNEHIDAIPNEVLMEKIFPTLLRSYTRLSSELKCCFIYCSTFPDCYSLTKDELVRLWIAQGYIISINLTDVEGLGYKCFEKLRKNSFFEFSHCKANTVRVITIPVFIHALAKHIAGNGYLALDELQNIPKNVRHLYVGSQEIMKQLSVATAMALHTFVLHESTSHETPDFILHMIRLRAIILIMHNVPELPGSIGNDLKPLRYLRVESYLIEKLPESIVNMSLLQVLDLSYCHNLKELPQEIGKLVYLRTLCLNGCKSIQELPTTVGELSLLQNLYLIGSSMRWMHPVIRKLVTLRRLHYKRTTCFTNLDSL